MITPPLSSATMANAATAASRCFVYGTLMSPEVLQVLLGRVPTMIPKATLRNHSRHPVRGRVYPGVIPAMSSGSGTDGGLQTSMNSVEGMLLLDVTALEVKCLDYFEDDDYTRLIVPVEIPGKSGNEDHSDIQTIQANAYIWSIGASKLDVSCEWDYGKFREQHLEWYLEKVVRPCRMEIERTIL